jgi:hypothetical protein
MKLPIDTEALAFICAGQPEACVDFETRRPKTDEAGVALYQVPLVAMADGVAEVIAVKVPGEPRGLVQGGPVRISGLTALAWSMGDRSGIAYRATRLEAATPTRSEAKAGS